MRFGAYPGWLDELDVKEYTLSRIFLGSTTMYMGYGGNKKF